MDIERELASIYKDAGGYKNNEEHPLLEAFKEIIRNRFSAYRFVESNNDEMKGLESEDMLLYLFKKDIEKNGFFVIENFDSLDFSNLKIHNPLERLLFNEGRKELLSVLESILENVKEQE